MIIQKDFLSKLKDFGLNTYEAKLWVALLSKGIATASELSDIANVPRSRSYDVLETLERKGFIILKIGKPIKYIVVPPSEVIESVKKNIQEESEKQKQKLDSLYNSKLIQELNDLHKYNIKELNLIEFTGIIRGKKNIINHYSNLFKNAQKNISIITTEQGFINKYNYLQSSLQKAHENGVSIKIIVPQTKKILQTIKNTEKIINIKLLNTDFMGRFCVVDGKTLNFFASDEENNDFCIYVNTPFVAKSFENIFSNVWSTLK